MASVLGLKCFLLQSWTLSLGEVGDESNSDSVPPFLVSKEDKVQGEGKRRGLAWIVVVGFPAKAT